MTIPVAYNVGATVYSQVNGLDFNMVAGGASPLPQLISIPSTGTKILSVATVSTSTGGNWLNITPAVGHVWLRLQHAIPDDRLAQSSRND